ncbi:MAG TPA: DUF1800 domain-containing protein [Isosphaeraceae bacterium]|jgi:uncharacterized protein (DUF1800 family)|nr:DUF1800 domain-containing protein [Isosphaeraceae bacterium]
MNDPAQAWEPYDPASHGAWDVARAAHLHRRAGFAASWPTLQRDLRDGPAASIDRLLDGEPTSLDGTPASEFAALLDAMASQLGTSGSLTRAQGVWLYRMIFTPHALLERMTLFWHNHFATSETKVNNLAQMQRQNALFRQHALGDFKALLGAIGKDPAMLVWLDSTVNRKARPNENYAREVMELFTLGRGHYTEKDVQEAARAFTGWFIVQDRFSEVPSQHDDGVKTILGQTGPFEGGDVARLLLEQPACAEFLCGKLFRYFVSEVDQPSAELMAPLATAFRDSGYNVRVPVKMILRSRLFHDADVRRHRVKSPVEYAVGTVRALEVLKPTVSADALAEACSRMGQSLYAPPSVAGWDGGPVWINTTATLARSNLALALLSDSDATFGKRFDPKRFAEKHGKAQDPAPFFIDLLVQDGFDAEIRQKVLDSAKNDAKAAVTLVLTAPEYQLS